MSWLLLNLASVKLWQNNTGRGITDGTTLTPPPRPPLRGVRPVSDN